MAPFGLPLLQATKSPKITHWISPRLGQRRNKTWKKNLRSRDRIRRWDHQKHRWNMLRTLSVWVCSYSYELPAFDWRTLRPFLRFAKTTPWKLSVDFSVSRRGNKNRADLVILFFLVFVFVSFFSDNYLPVVDLVRKGFGEERSRRDKKRYDYENGEEGLKFIGLEVTNCQLTWRWEWRRRTAVLSFLPTCAIALDLIFFHKSRVF